MAALKLVPVGDDIGLALPAELLAGMGVHEGDTLYAHLTPDGLSLTVGDAVFGEQLELARRLMRERRGVLSTLTEK